MEHQFYSLEMGQAITVRGLTALGMIKAEAVLDHLAPRNYEAAQMAAFLEALRDGVVIPKLTTNQEVIDFARNYKQTALRAFNAIQGLTVRE